MGSARIPLHMGGSTPHQGGRHLVCSSSWHMEGYLPITPLKSGLANQWPSSMSGHISLEVHYPMVSTGSDIIPSAKFMCSFWHLQPCHITCGLYPSSMDARVDVHSRSHNFPLIHPREVLLAGYWVTTLSIFSCGIISVSPPVKVSLHGSWAWYTCPMHDRHLYIREPQPLMQWEEVGFSGGCMTFCIGPSFCKRRCLSWSDAPPPMYPLPTYPWFSSFPVKASVFTSTRSPGFRFTAPIFLS